MNSVSTPEKKKLLDSLNRLNGRKILVIGDVGVDEYIMGEVRRISPEAPVPVLEVASEDWRLGLAANVAQNIASLGGVPILVSIIGHDAGAEMLTKLFQKSQVSTEYLISDASRPTTRKARVMAKHHHLVRVDYELKKYITSELEQKVLAKVEAALPQADAVILEDYAKGLVTQTLVKKLVELCRKQGKKILVDPHRSNPVGFYEGVDLLKPNFDEAIALSGLDHDDLRDHPNKVFEVGQALQKKTGAKEVVITRGKDGMTIFSGAQVTQVPTYARQVFDVTGAGDTVIAALALALTAGLSLTEACQMANFAAGVVVGQIGCVPCTQQELRDYIHSTP